MARNEMNEYRINADVVNWTNAEGVLTLGFLNTTNGQGQPIYLLLQRAERETAVYIEVNDQINSGYDLITALSDKGGDLAVMVRSEFQGLGNAGTIRVTYPLTDRNREVVQEGIKQIMNGA